MELGDVIHVLYEVLLKYNYPLRMIDIFILYGLLEGESHKRIASMYSLDTFYVVGNARVFWNMLSHIAGYEVNQNNFYPFINNIIIQQQKISQENSLDVDISRIERSIEFPSGYWEAGTSILSYFSRILNVKYPDKKLKVKIEQEGLTLRMIIDTPDGGREEIEKTLDEYGLVIVGKMQPEEFMSDPIEAMALKNKLGVADLELRQTKQLLEFIKDNSQQRIGSLEMQVEKLHSIIEHGLHSGNNVIGVINKMAEQNIAVRNQIQNWFVAAQGFEADLIRQLI
jgi:hypothetical protein